MLFATLICAKCDTPILTLRMALTLYANILYMRYMIPSMELKAKAPLVNAQVLEASIIYFASHVLVSHGKIVKSCKYL